MLFVLSGLFHTILADGDLIDHHIDHNDRERRFLVYVPDKEKEEKDLPMEMFSMVVEEVPTM